MAESLLGSGVRGRWVGMALVVGAFVIGAGMFLPRQCLWLDEATQMTGLAMGPAGAARWLAGVGASATGQFPDRMPPLGYWVGWGWSQLFGFNEASLRWCGVVCVALATALVYDAARRAFGAASACAAGLLFGLSPAVVVTAVEIRPYPLFLLCAAAAFHALVCVYANPPERRAGAYVSLALALGASMGTHFFGAVMAAAMLVALAVLAARGQGGWRPVAGVGVAVAVSLALVAPFVVAAFAESNPVATMGAGTLGRLESVKNLLVRSFTHVTLSVYRPVPLVAGVAGVLLLLLAAGVPRSSRLCARAVALTLAAGVLGVTAGRFVLDGFDAASVSYNIWMRPGLCILLSAGVAAQGAWVRRIAGTACVCLLAAQVCGVYELAAHGDHFAHGPHREIVRLLRSCPPGEVALVHDDPTHRFVFVACPLRWELKGQLAQFTPASGASDPAAAVVRDTVGQSSAQTVTALPYRYLLVVRAAMTNPPNVAAQVRSGDRPMADGPIASVLRGSSDWQLVAERTSVAHISAKLDLFASRRPVVAAPPRIARENAAPFVPNNH